MLLLLGEPRVRLADGRWKPWPRSKEGQLFALLALEAGKHVPRFRVESELWPKDRDPHSPPVVSKLNKLLREEGLEDTVAAFGTELAFAQPGAVTIDLLEAEKLVDAAAREAAGGLPGLAWEQLEDAIELLGPQFFAGVRATPFIDRCRERQARLLSRAQVLACEVAAGGEDGDRHAAAEREARSAIRADPYREAPYVALARLLLAIDRHTDVLDLIAGAERKLDAPSPALEQLRGEALVGLVPAAVERLPLVLSVAPTDEQAAFAGRDQQLEDLTEAAAHAQAGRFAGRVLVGEKGVGKSRLAREFGARAHQLGFGVLSVAAIRQPAEYDRPCKPLVDAVLAWSRQVDAVALRALDQATLVELTPSSPALGEELGVGPPLVGPGREFRLRQALVGAVRDIARVHPTLLLVDDLGELDEQTGVCIREIYADRPDGLMLLATSSEEGVGGLPLRPISVEKLGLPAAFALARTVLGPEATEEEVAGLVERAGALPFMIVHQAEPHRIMQDFVAPLIAPLGSGGLEVMRLAALLGPRLDLDVLRRAAADEELVDRTLTLVEAKELIGPDVSGDGLVFRHSLTRDAICGDIGSVEQRKLSERLERALEGEKTLSAARLQVLEGGGQGGGREALAAALEAGDHASEITNYRAALDHYRKGLELAGEAEVDLRGRLLVGIAQSLWSLGRYADARATFQQALALADLDPALRAVAALGFGGKLGFGGSGTDREYIGALEEVLPLLGAEHPLRLRVQAALAGALAFGARSAHEVAEREELVRVVLAAIGGEADAALRAAVLSDVCWTAWDPGDAPARRRLADEFVAVADASHDIGLAIEARIFRVAVALADGEMRTFRSDLGRATRLGRQAGLPHFEALLDLLEAMDSLLAGELAEARQYSDAALEVGGREQNPAVLQLYGAQTLMVHLFEGRLDQIRAAALGVAGAFPQMPAWKAGLGLIYAELGREEDARQQLELIAVEDFGLVPRDLFWLVTMDHAAKLAAKLGDRGRCAALYELVAPHAGEIVVAGAAVAVYGAIDRVLGLTAAVAGDAERAVEHLRDAVAINDRIGARAVNAYVMTELAAQLLARGEKEEAEAVRAEAEAIAAATGLSLQMQGQAARFSTPAHPRGPIGTIKQGGAATISQLIKRAIDGKTDAAMNQLRGTRVLRWLMPTAFLPSAACGWTGTIQLEFEPPIGYRTKQRYWTIAIEPGEPDKARVSAEEAAQPAVRLKLAPATFFKLMAGTLNPVAAWLDREVDVEGDPTVAARLVEMFSGPTPAVDFG